MGWIEKIGYIQGNIAAGLHLRIAEDGEWSFDVVALKKSRKLITVAASMQDICSLETLESIIPLTAPVIISVEGKGIIHKIVNLGENTSPVLQIIPGAQPLDFIVQTQEIEPEKGYVSLVRREIVDEILKDFREKGYYVNGLFLGPFSMNSCWALLNEQHRKCRIDIYTIDYSGNIITSLEVSGKTEILPGFMLGDESLEAWQMLPYANALSYFTGVRDKLQLSPDPSLPVKEEYLFRRAYRYAAAGLLSLLFVTLLVNFFLYDLYNRRFNALSVEYKSSMELIQRLEKLKSDVNLKEALIGESGLLESSKFSFYADRIAALVPERTVLTRLEISPLTEKPKTEKQIVFQSNLIVISGRCRFSQDVDNWMETLKKEQWISRLEIMQYKQENKESSGEFQLKLVLR